MHAGCFSVFRFHERSLTHRKSYGRNERYSGGDFWRRPRLVTRRTVDLTGRAVTAPPPPTEGCIVKPVGMVLSFCFR